MKMTKTDHALETTAKKEVLKDCTHLVANASAEAQALCTPIVDSTLFLAGNGHLTISYLYGQSPCKKALATVIELANQCNEAYLGKKHR